ncbi:MAG: glutaredoxin [Oscillochloris sp.]|nr:glutaredoxin [Oscillochloris sp.]
MGLMKDKDREAVGEAFAGLKQAVHIVLATSAETAEYSAVANQLLAEVAKINPQIRIETVDLQSARAAELGLDKAPGLAFLRGSEQADHGIRFAGLPTGYEFVTLIEAIRLVGDGSEARLQPATVNFLQALDHPMRLQVFVTPTCPYCPRAVVLAYQLALASPFVHAEGVEVSEFPELGDRYAVMGVPKTVIDEIVHVEGAAPESMLLEKLREALVAEAA